MGHAVCSLRSVTILDRFVGIQHHHLPFLDDLILPSATALDALATGQTLLLILPLLCRLVRPTKCVGSAEPTARLAALGTPVELAEQKFFVPHHSTSTPAALRGRSRRGPTG